MAAIKKPGGEPGSKWKFKQQNKVMKNLNNSSMKTVVETFIMEETQELLHDNEKLDQWNSYVEELGLQGQTKVKAVGKAPIPYLFMNTAMVNVFSVLCPMKVRVEAYDKTPIPVEILSLVAMSKKEEHFSKVEIWYNESDPDPVCIGFRQNAQFDRNYPTWERGLDKYLIGRWADVKMSLDALTQKAKGLFIAQKSDQYNNELRSAQRKLEDLESEANRAFGHVLPNTPSISELGF